MNAKITLKLATCIFVVGACQQAQANSAVCNSPEKMKFLFDQVAEALQITDMSKQERPDTCEGAAGTWDNFLFEPYNSLPDPENCKRYAQQIKKARADLRKRGAALQKGCTEPTVPAEAAGADESSARPE